HLAEYRAEHNLFAQSAVRRVLRGEAHDTVVPANRRSISRQLTVLNAYKEAATAFAGVRRQLVQLKDTCEKWTKSVDRLKNLDRAAKAVEPFLRFPALVHDQVSG